MKKITILLAGLALTGCANLKYPGWQDVKIIESAYQQPCRKAGIDECSAGGCENDNDWFKKRATKYDGNNVVFNLDKETGNLKSASYFYCAQGLPPYEDDIPPLYIVRNNFNPTATKIDYEKANAECEYEAHKSTIETASPGQTRPYISGMGLENSLSQLSALHQDQQNIIYHAEKMKREKEKLYSECLAAKGFVSTLSIDKKDRLSADKYCPDKTSLIRYCYMPASDK